MSLCCIGTAEPENEPPRRCRVGLSIGSKYGDVGLPLHLGLPCCARHLWNFPKMEAMFLAHKSLSTKKKNNYKKVFRGEFVGL